MKGDEYVRGWERQGVLFEKVYYTVITFYITFLIGIVTRHKVGN
jgi:hypothetical protein